MFKGFSPENRKTKLSGNVGTVFVDRYSVHLQSMNIFYAKYPDTCTDEKLQEHMIIWYQDIVLVVWEKQRISEVLL